MKFVTKRYFQLVANSLLSRSPFKSCHVSIEKYNMSGRTLGCYNVVHFKRTSFFRIKAHDVLVNNRHSGLHFIKHPF